MNRPKQFTVSVLASLWLCTYSVFVWAAATTSYADEFRQFDFESLAFAAGTGLMGGAGRTLWSLGTKRKMIFDTWIESIKDLILSTLVGVAVYLLLLWAVPQALVDVVGRGGRMGILVLAGFFRTQTIDALGAILSGYLARVKATASGNPIPPGQDPPPSAVTPLESTK